MNKRNHACTHHLHITHAHMWFVVNLELIECNIYMGVPSTCYLIAYLSYTLLYFTTNIPRALSSGKFQCILRTPFSHARPCLPCILILKGKHSNEIAMSIKTVSKSNSSCNANSWRDCTNEFKSNSPLQ